MKIIKSKKEEKIEKKALGAYSKQYKQRCHKSGKYGYKPGDQNAPKIKMKKMKNLRKQKRMK